MTHVWPWIDISIYSFVPLALVALFTTAIVRKTSKTQRQTHSAASYADDDDAHEANDAGVSSSTSATSSNTKFGNIMIAMLVSLFLATVPTVTLYILMQTQVVNVNAKALLVMRYVFGTLQFVHHSIKFLYYFIWDGSFRRGFSFLFNPSFRS